MKQVSGGTSTPTTATANRLYRPRQHPFGLLYSSRSADHLLGETAPQPERADAPHAVTSARPSIGLLQFGGSNEKGHQGAGHREAGRGVARVVCVVLVDRAGARALAPATRRRAS